MEGIHDFFTQVSAQLPQRFFDSQVAEDTELLKAAYLWSLLQMIHEDLNALCRRNPFGVLGPQSVRAINRSFDDVQQLLCGSTTNVALSKLEPEKPPTNADALVAVSLYKSALRYFRVEQLREDPYSF